MQQRRLGEARKKAEMHDAAPDPAQALARGFALMAFAQLNPDRVAPLELSREDVEAYERWAAVRRALRR